MQPKTKAQKEADARKKAAEEQKVKEEAARVAKAERLKAEEDAIRAAAAKGMCLNHADELMRPINNRALANDEIAISGFDNAVDALVRYIYVYMHIYKCISIYMYAHCFCINL